MDMLHVEVHARHLAVLTVLEGTTRAVAAPDLRTGRACSRA